MFKSLSKWVFSFAASVYAPWILFIVAFTESSFFLIPPDVLLIPMCLAEPKWAFAYAGLCTVGSVLGGVFGYYIGQYGGRPVLKKLISEERIKTAEYYFNKYDGWAIGVAGFTPIPYKVFTILAGILHVRLQVLIVASIFSRGARFFLIATLLYFFGDTARLFIENHLGLASLILVVVMLLGYFSFHFIKVKRRKKRLNSIV